MSIILHSLLLLCNSNISYFLGAMFAGTGLIERGSGLIGNMILNNIYAATLHFFKGFVFMILASGFFTTAGIMV